MTDKNIIEILKKHKLRSLARSASYTEARDRYVGTRATSVKAILNGDLKDAAVPVPVTLLRIIYYNMLHDYKGTSPFFSKDMNKRSEALWKRVEASRQKARCKADRYIKAQFVWFDKAFGKAPTLIQLAGDSAIDRATEFTGSTKGRVLGNMRKAPVTRADTFRASEMMLQNMMTAQSCTREEFYTKFVLTGLHTFPKDFLKADPTYQRLLSK